MTHTSARIHRSARPRSWRPPRSKRKGATAMPTLGIIGSGNIGSAVARLAVAADIDVVIANSRGPQSLTQLVEELGHLGADQFAVGSS
ncbi:NAD(P)-binding domain-containing protein [Streptomyces sp. NPDC003758]